MRRAGAPVRHPERPVVQAPRQPTLLPAPEQVLALQRTAGNRATTRALLQRDPPDPPAGVSLGKDPLPTGANVAKPGDARVTPADKDHPLPGGWADQSGQKTESGVVGGTDRILLEGLPGNQRQQGEQTGSRPHGKDIADTAGSGPAGARGRAIVVIPHAVKTGAAGEVAVIVQLHGIKEALRERGNNPRDVREYQVEQQLEAFVKARPGTRIIAILPLGRQTESDDKTMHGVSFGDLDVDKLVAAVFGKLGDELPSGCTPGDVILSAHSGGGLQLGNMLTSGAGLPKRLAGVFLFEALHKDTDNYATWITGRMQHDLDTLASLRKEGKSRDATDDAIFADQARYLEASTRVIAFGGAGNGYDARTLAIRKKMLEWWAGKAAGLKAAAGAHTVLLDTLWTHYQAQFFPDSHHEDALATARNNLGRALATLPTDIGTKPAAPPAAPPAPPPATAPAAPVGAGSGVARSPVLARDDTSPPPTFKKEKYDLSKDQVVVVKEDESQRHAEITDAPADYADEILKDAGFKPADWFKSFTRITFLGQKVSEPVHTDLAAHLATAEKAFADKYGAGDVKAAGTALGIRDEPMPGARHAPTSAAVSMHLFGLAIDINYTTNPFISKSANPVFQHAADLLGETTKGFAPGMSYDELAELDLLLENYFNMITDVGRLEVQLQSATKAPWKGRKPDAAGRIIKADLNDLTGRWERSDKDQKTKIRVGGFLDLAKQLVDEIGLEWGGSGYGDMMHFDMRNQGNGAKIHSAGERYKTKKEAESVKEYDKAHPSPPK